MLREELLNLGGVHGGLLVDAERVKVLARDVVDHPRVHLDEVRLHAPAADGLDADGARPREEVEPTRIRGKRGVAPAANERHDHVKRGAADHPHHRPGVET